MGLSASAVPFVSPSGERNFTKYATRPTLSLPLLRDLGTERLKRKEVAYGATPLRFENLFDHLFKFRLQVLKELKGEKKETKPDEIENEEEGLKEKEEIENDSDNISNNAHNLYIETYNNLLRE